jgi:hypothetical protein
MKQNSVFAAAVVVLVAVIAVQSMRSDAIAGAPQPLPQVSPFELMQGARDLPAERIDYPY